MVKFKWSNDSTFSELYDIDSETITIINQLDENPCSDKHIKEHAQSQHSGINVSGENSVQDLCIVLLTINRHIIYEMIQWWLTVCLELIVLSMG